MPTLKIVSASGSASLTVDNDTTVGDTRALAVASLGLTNIDPQQQVRLNFRGAVLHDDSVVWGQLNPLDGDKLYVAVDTSAAVAGRAHPGVGSVTANRLATAPQAAPPGLMPNLSPAQADAFLEMVTPEFIDMMMATVPELRALARSNPDAVRELRDPEVFKQILRAQLDPESRRQFQMTQAHQLAQVSNIPGGWGLVERMMHSVQRDDAAHASAEQPSDESVESQVNYEPRADRTANDAALPNPWAPTAQPQRVVQHATYAYASQLEILTEMGFETDIAQLALDEAGGDIGKAVLILESWMN